MSGSPIAPAILSTSIGQLSTTTANIGFVSGSAAALNVNGGTFAVTGSSNDDLLIGRAGAPARSMSTPRAHVTLTDTIGHAVLGMAAGVTGTANVSGAGATWTDTNDNVSADFRWVDSASGC